MIDEIDSWFYSKTDKYVGFKYKSFYERVLEGNDRDFRQLLQDIRNDLNISSISTPRKIEEMAEKVIININQNQRKNLSNLINLNKYLKKIKEEGLI